jgi:hypothetical protein
MEQFAEVTRQKTAIDQQQAPYLTELNDVKELINEFETKAELYRVCRRPETDCICGLSANNIFVRVKLRARLLHGWRRRTRKRIGKTNLLKSSGNSMKPKSCQKYLKMSLRWVVFYAPVKEILDGFLTELDEEGRGVLRAGRKTAVG